MLFQMAWRNVRAGKKRSLLTVALVAVSTALFIFFTGMTEGSHRKMIRDAVDIYTGYIQVQGKDFEDYPDYDHLIYTVDLVMKTIEGTPRINIAAPRMETYVLYSTDNDSVGGFLAGIVPHKESHISRIDESIVEGRYLTSTDGASVVLGVELARKLKVTVGDRITYISTGLDFAMAADYLTVVGLFKTGMFEFDATASFVNKMYMDELFLSENAASQIVIVPNRMADVPQIVSVLKTKLKGEYDVLSWRELLEELVQAVEVDSVFGYLSMVIFFGVIFFVIMLYTLIAVMLRIREIGVMKALGTTPTQVFLMLIYEAVITGLFGILIGAVIGSGIAGYFQMNPIQIGDMADMYKDIGIVVDTIPAVLSVKLVVINVIIVFMINLLSVVYPALKVNWINPKDAMVTYK